MVLGNYNGTPSRTVTPLQAIQDMAKGKARVYYAKGCEVIHDKTEHLATTHDRISEAVSAALQSDVAIICVGLNSNYEGEEGDEGNAHAGGDKVDLLLPGLQNELVEAIVGTGTKTILVNMTGSAMDLTWAHDHVDSIIQAWYPGAEGSEALAELNFGQTDFSARTPVTWVKHTDDLPDFLDYSMKNRTYRYIESVPMYPFGYGLSYNNYEYSDLKVNEESIAKGDNLEVSIKVTNKSEMSGREVVQIYLTDIDASVDVPWHSLVAFDNVQLDGGESKTIHFTIDSRQMAVIDNEGKEILEPGDYIIYGGGQGPDKQSEHLTGKIVLQQGFSMI